jgi:uncharacterized membrane protein YgdD (TMEM256/DUF423 family)
VRKWLFIAGSNGAVAVLAGAFAVHVLGRRLDSASLSAFTTGAHYHLVHAVVMAVAALAARGAAKPLAQSAAMLFFIGILLFSGSLYGLALTQIRVIGFITPLGGLALVAGWVVLALAALKLKETL